MGVGYGGNGGYIHSLSRKRRDWGSHIGPYPLFARKRRLQLFFCPKSVIFRVLIVYSTHLLEGQFTIGFDRLFCGFAGAFLSVWLWLSSHSAGRVRYGCACVFGPVMAARLACIAGRCVVGIVLGKTGQPEKMKKKGCFVFLGG